MQLTLANFLTLLRLFAIPIFLVFLVDGRYPEALGVFVAAGVTDALDGAIARLTHTKTTLGSYLDPAADKLLLLSSFIALGFLAAMPRWLGATCPRLRPESRGFSAPAGTTTRMCGRL